MKVVETVVKMADWKVVRSVVLSGLKKVGQLVDDWVVTSVAMWAGSRVAKLAEMMAVLRAAQKVER